MAANSAQNKGKNGEREVVNLLKEELLALIMSGRYEPDVCQMLRDVAQRNQNQSAVGGGDINLFGLSIEVKRQETLNVEAWWKQCVTSAIRNGDKPVLIYRQNGTRSWHVVTDGFLWLPDGRMVCSRMQTSELGFRAWFRAWVECKLKQGEVERV